ncbi:hypothetical protein GI584_08490 [Gracilibacillus salitolerans]|uniref:Acylneuraminate cytidylyltransferase family protein n=1 Tax=Gracilibacillus salitolerans TaxID=2663022 RepID=A0A5Q2TH69_9BACI|nr:acylneuraminate cytidylyltransferase family protein [Gracilibacillus salitolerans]QGH34056.1 hypothetical protein GI584_08490 [Gracilibacillus salitolerans]
MLPYLGKNIAFIPVRGGSKSIPLKNIKKINGEPLVYWVLNATAMCPEIDHVVVSTDCANIKNVINSYNFNNVTIIDRSFEVSTDQASTEAVMLEFTKKYDFDNIVLTQATSPLLSKNDISKGLILFESTNVDSVISVVRQKRFIWEDYGDGAVPINYNIYKRPRRQDFDGYLIENGAYYITSRKELIKTGNRISGCIGTVEMAEETYYEIDEPSDWIIAESLMKSLNK